MRWVADGIAVDGAHAPLLQPTSFGLQSGQVQLAAGLPGEGHTALALVAGGRMRADRGLVQLDGNAATAPLRRAVAIVDTPGVSEPDGPLRLATVVGEELAMARRPTGRRAVSEWLAEHDASEHAATRLEDVPGHVRLRLLAELAAARPGVRALVMTVPDRHGGDPRWWWELACGHAMRGTAVLVTCLDISAQLLGVRPAVIGAADPGDPVTVAADPEDESVVHEGQDQA